MAKCATHCVPTLPNYQNVIKTTIENHTHSFEQHIFTICICAVIQRNNGSLLKHVSIDLHYFSALIHGKTFKHNGKSTLFGIWPARKTNKQLKGLVRSKQGRRPWRAGCTSTSHHYQRESLMQVIDAATSVGSVLK